MVAGNFGENTLRVGVAGAKYREEMKPSFISGKLRVCPITLCWAPQAKYTRGHRLER